MSQDVHERLESLGCYMDENGNWQCPLGPQGDSESESQDK